MNRIEFINTLRRSLTNKLSPEEINEHVRYYEEYIDMQIKKGMSEEEVLESLGEPRLLAKSILAASGVNAGADVYSQSNSSQEQAGRTSGSARVVRIPLWLVAIVAILIIAVVVVCLLAVTVVALKILIPVLLIIFLIRIIIRTLKSR